METNDHILKQLFNRAILYAIILTLSVCCTGHINAQENTQSDSTEVIKHSPKKATYLALIPGLGQIYNKKYWKLPIVYAGFAVTGYSAIFYRGEYIKYNDAYVCKLNDQDECDNELAIKYDENRLKSARDWNRRNMELSFIIMGAWYILQILDATVDAHLYYWEVNDDLSVRAEPMFQQLPVQSQQFPPGNNTSYNGLKITVRF